MRGLKHVKGVGFFGPSERHAFNDDSFRTIHIVGQRPIDVYPNGPTFEEQVLEVNQQVLQQDGDEIVARAKGISMKSGMVIIKPGLHKRYNAWAICHGLYAPVIYVDPQTPTSGGHNALIMHECYHAEYHHRLKQILCLVIPVLGWILYPFLAARHEVLADAAALNTFGKPEYMAFLHLHKEPTTWWGKWKYGRSRDARYARAQECLQAQVKGER